MSQWNQTIYKKNDDLNQLKLDTTENLVYITMYEQINHKDKRKFLNLNEKIQTNATNNKNVDKTRRIKKQEKFYQCKDCPYNSYNIGAFWTHRKLIHDGYMFNCDICEYKSPHSSIIRTHKLKTHDPTHLVCNKCPYQSWSQHTLKEHLRVKHEGNKYQCNQCNYKYKYKTMLSRHKQSKHGLLVTK